MISDTGRRLSSTLIISMALNHIEDRGQQGLHLSIRGGWGGEPGWE